MILCAGATVTTACGNNNKHRGYYRIWAWPTKPKNETEQYRNEMNGAELKQKSNADGGYCVVARVNKCPN
jgi:hypothetical protein